MKSTGTAHNSDRINFHFRYFSSKHDEQCVHSARTTDNANFSSPSVAPRTRHPRNVYCLSGTFVSILTAWNCLICSRSTPVTARCCFNIDSPRKSSDSTNILKSLPHPPDISVTVTFTAFGNDRFNNVCNSCDFPVEWMTFVLIK